MVSSPEKVNPRNSRRSSTRRKGGHGSSDSGFFFCFNAPSISEAKSFAISRNDHNAKKQSITSYIISLTGTNPENLQECCLKVDPEQVFPDVFALVAHYQQNRFPVLGSPLGHPVENLNHTIELCKPIFKAGASKPS